MKITDSNRKALTAFMASRGLKVAPWSKKAGVPESAVRNFLAGRSSTMTATTYEKLAAAADVSVDELLGAQILRPRSGKDVISVKRLNVRASMGGGYEVLDEGEIEPIYFRRDWIDSIMRKETGQLRALDLEGDSNFPTLSDGDIGLFRLKPKFEPGRFYAIWDGRGLIVKRLDTVIGARPRLRIISDNSELYPTYEVDVDEVTIIARLIWRGGLV